MQAEFYVRGGYERSKIIGYGHVFLTEENPEKRLISKGKKREVFDQE
jgi:hypothetical protein